MSKINKLAREYSCVDISKSDSLAQIVVKEANAKKDANNLGLAFNTLGRNFICQSKAKEAIDALEKSCTFLVKAKDNYNYAKALNNLGNAYRINASYDDGIKVINKQIEIAKQIKNDTILSSAYATLSGIYSMKSLSDSTALYAQRALEIAKENKLDDLIWKSAVILGGGFYNNEDFEKSIQYYSEVLPILEKKKDERNLGLVYNNIAASYNSLKQFEIAKEFYDKSMKLAKKTDFKQLILVNYSGLAHIYSDMDDYVTSNKYYDYMLELSKAIDIPDLKMDALSNLSNNYYQQGFHKKALVQAESALEYAKTNDMDILVKETNKFLYKIHKALNNNKASLKHLEAYNDLVENEFELEKEGIVEELGVKYETEKVQREKESAEKNAKINALQSTKNKNLFIGSAIIAGLILLLSLFYFGRLEANKKAEVAAAELAQVESELKALRSQMNPHFIFNSLNSIQDLILKEETDLSYDYVVMFADLVRKTLHHSERKFLPLEEEIEFIETYLGLEKLRFKKDFTYEINDHVEDELNTPSLLVQPFIENAIKHGLLHKKGEKHLKINYHQKGDTLICTIEDNGIGRQEASKIRNRQNPSHQSFSTEAMKKRLTYLGEQYGVNTGFTFEDIPSGGTKVTITMPCKQL